MAATSTSFTIDQEPISSPRAILCEGAQDRNFFQELIKARNLPDFYVTHPHFEIEPGGRGGYSARLRSMKLQVGWDNLQGIIVVSDNDSDPAGSFQMVRRLVHEASLTPPNQPLTIKSGSPSIAIMMLPATDTNGQLETLCLQAIRAAWPSKFRCAESYAACAEIVGVPERAWSQNKREKAMLRALISHICKKDPNTSLAHLWHDGRELVIPLADNCFDEIANFLRDFDEIVAAGRALAGG